MPWNGRLSSLWNQEKLYKPGVIGEAVGASNCVICRSSEMTLLNVCPGCFADLPRRAPKMTRSIPFVDEAFAPFRYEFPVTDIVRAAKFEGDLAALRALGCGFDTGLARAIGIADWLVPVPLLPWRFLRRGFNQSLELARLLSMVTAVPVRNDVVRRGRFSGAAQSRLNAAARHANAATAFRINIDLSEAHVIIVDDVITTGATCSALARALRESGVRRVTAVAAAATPHNHGSS